ncbi:MAG: VWA domain-containing protein [Proteobacteria bacterium]|nr:VWA domain-containing protein [Pseudomonadota bacterium]
MRFGDLTYLWLFWIIPVLVAFLAWAHRRRRQLVRNFLSPNLEPVLMGQISQTRRIWKSILLLAGMVFVFLSLLRPQWGYHWEDIQRRGSDIVIVLDVSKSMLAEDIKPSRLERARQKIKDLVGMMEGDRVGLVAFAGTAFIQCPLTLDYGALNMFLDYADTDLIPLPGTAIEKAIKESIKIFEPSGSSQAGRAVILITDGEDHEGDPVQSAEEAKKEGIRIYTIGIGQESGAPIPVSGEEGGGFKKDKSGSLVISRLNEEVLQKIALITGGSYVHSVAGDIDLEKIYREGIRQEVSRTELKSTRRKRMEERFQWPLLLGIVLIAAGEMLGERKRGASRSLGRQPALRNIWVSFKSKFKTQKSK